MKTKLSNILTCSLLAAGLAAGAVSASAANRSTSPAQQKQIVTGMTTSQVSAALGTPVMVVKYKVDSGPTWIYSAAQGNMSVGAGGLDFTVTFDSGGKVVLAEEWEKESND